MFLYKRNILTQTRFRKSLISLLVEVVIEWYEIRTVRRMIYCFPFNGPQYLSLASFNQEHDEQDSEVPRIFNVDR